MNKLYLKFPDITDKDNYVKYQMEEHGITLDFDKWLKEKIESSNQVGIINNKVPRTILLLTDSAKTIYGQCSIRFSIDTPKLSRYIGNIGYEIKSNYRGNKLGNLILKLALEYCKNSGMTKVMISCKTDNIASAKVIENNGEILEKIIYVAEEKAKYKIY